MVSPQPHEQLRIAQIAPPHWPSPPSGFGGSELVAGNLADELVRQGHEVVLFGHPESPTLAELVSFPEAHNANDFAAHELIHTARALEQAGDFDIVHNHCLTAGPALASLITVPSLTTLHYMHPVVRAFPEHPYVAISQAQAAASGELNIIRTVHNGVDVGLFPIVFEKEDYLLYMGRMDVKKGPDLAVQVAQELGARLVLAGPGPAPDAVEYFDTQIRPHLGGRIEYVGHVAGQQKLELLSRARAVLVPSRWEEPFGLVAVEALACCTRVIASNRGALPEIIADGVTGYLVNTVDEMVAAVGKLDELSPVICRQVAEENFSAQRMTEGYLGVYAELLARCGQREAMTLGCSSGDRRHPNRYTA